MSEHSLVGQYFWFDDHHETACSLLGQILAEPKPGVYLIQTHEWWWNNTPVRQLVSVEQMLKDRWQFFDDLFDASVAVKERLKEFHEDVDDLAIEDHQEYEEEVEISQNLGIDENQMKETQDKKDRKHNHLKKLRERRKLDPKNWRESESEDKSEDDIEEIA